MLYHVPDLDRALGEIARVLVPGGRLVAATNAAGHLFELWALVGRDKLSEPRQFLADTGEEELARHFVRVERRDLESTVTFQDADAARGYVASSIAHKHLAERVPADMGPLAATRRNSVFVAETAA
jgi:SAM-dependent methyltransferase